MFYIYLTIKFNTMKKLLVIGAVALFGIMNAQTFGVKAGANFSSVNGITGLDQKGKIGFYAGILMNAPIAAEFSIQPEVLYSNLGAKTSGDIASSIHLDYISVPVMFQYNVLPQLYIEAGPQFSFLLDSRVTSDNAEIEQAGNELVKKDNLKGFDFGAGLGAGYFFTPNIGLTARYVAGFTDIAKNRAGDDSNRARNNVFQLGLAYKFSK